MPHRPEAEPGRPPWQARILTLFPEMFPGPLGLSLVGQALTGGLWRLDTHQIRDFGIGRHRAVDDTPAGGGAGMVMRADVLAQAIDQARAEASSIASPGASPGAATLPALYMTPRGQPLTQALARELAAGPGVIILAGRFEGIDERVIEGRALMEVSIGDYVLSGGELAAMVLLDACVRLLPGVLGSHESLTHESFEAGLLEHPQYTRPRDWEGRAIPEVLLSGDHAKIAAWRESMSVQVTRDRRPDLLRRNISGGGGK
ncbi:MAG: tRNA (guanosine(37)-N1)-methyltransferase TrmD [Hyphomicrobiaceae bacterium]|nr:tRNA (guanosine(37)-N1)-methyltransferase TrmD [Hyphomicrobiaceae bacterium]